MDGLGLKTFVYLIFWLQNWSKIIRMQQTVTGSQKLCPRNGDLLRGRVLSIRRIWWVNQTRARRSRNPSRNSRPYYIRACENHSLSFHKAEKLTFLFLGGGVYDRQVFHQKNKDIDTMDMTWLELNFAHVSKYKAAVYHPDVLTIHLQMVDIALLC